MKQNQTARKSFAPTANNLMSYEALPPLLAQLLDAEHLLVNPSNTDLREMSKFTELPNLQGVAAHPINYSSPELAEQFQRAAWNELLPAEIILDEKTSLPPALQIKLKHTLKQQPNLVITGRLAANSRFPLEVAAI